jgi:hypothetical protein
LAKKAGDVTGQLKKEKKQINIEVNTKNSNRQEPIPPVVAQPEAPSEEMVISLPDHLMMEDKNLVVIDNKQWIEGLNEGVLKDLSPFIKGAIGLVAPAIELKEKSQHVIENTPGPGVFYYNLKRFKPNKEELAKLEKRARMEERRLQSLQRQQKRMQDSLQFVYNSAELEANLYQTQIARAKKEIEIAPFRVWGKQEYDQPGAATYNFSFFKRH